MPESQDLKNAARLLSPKVAKVTLGGQEVEVGPITVCQVSLVLAEVFSLIEGGLEVPDMDDNKAMLGWLMSKLEGNRINELTAQMAGIEPVDLTLIELMAYWNTLLDVNDPDELKNLFGAFGNRVKSIVPGLEEAPKN